MTERRIWEVPADRLRWAVGVLLGREQLEALSWLLEGHDESLTRTECLIDSAARRCGHRCPYAATVEALLWSRAQKLRARLAACPMAELAGEFARSRPSMGGAELAALLWALSADGRCELEPLAERVQGELFGRAIRLLSRPGPHGA